MSVHGIRQENVSPSVVITSNVKGSEGKNSVKDIVCGKCHLRDYNSPNLSDSGIRGECDRCGNCEVVKKLERQRLWGLDRCSQAFRRLKVATQAFPGAIEA